MGANTFTVESRGFTVQIGKNRYRKKNHPYINYRQARAFKERFDFPAMVSVYTICIRHGHRKIQVGKNPSKCNRYRIG